jgi:hypothetical protein
MLTAKRLREVLSYNPDTGVWTWLLPTGRRVRAGSRAGRIDCHGRWRIGLDGRYYTGFAAGLPVHDREVAAASC